MTFKEIIARQRELYLTDLLDFYKERTSGVREVMLELNKEEPIPIFKTYRLDHYDQIDGQSKPTELNSDKYLDFDPINYEFGSLKIELSPFYWNGCEFILNPIPADLNWLILWAKKWIDIEENKSEDANGLMSVVHNVTKPKQTEIGYSFSVDFGTADIEAFFELLDEIANQDVKEVRVGSFSMMD
jgi:hypothetical protein